MVHESTGMANSSSSDLSRGKTFLQKLQYIQHVDKRKDTFSETFDRYLKEYLVTGRTNFDDLSFTEFLRNPKANLTILKKSLEDRVTFVKVCSHPLRIDLELSDVPIHEYVVFTTENYSTGQLKRTWWSLETNGQQIVLQQSFNKDDVINKIYDTEKKESVERSERSIRDRERDSGPFRINVEEILRDIWDNNQISEPYHVVTSNSQLFASFIFEKISTTVIGLSKMRAFRYKSILYDQHFDCYRAMMEGRREDFEQMTNNLTFEILNSVDSQGYTLLEWATVFSTPDWPIDEELKEKGIGIPSDQGLFRQNVFFITLQYQPQNKKSLSFDGIDIHGVNKTGDTALHLALYEEEWKLAEEILNRIEDYDVNITNSLGDTPLLLAAKLQCGFGLFNEILNRTNSANINKVDANGWTALHYAIVNKSENKIEELLNDKDVDVNVKNNEDNRTSLHLASNWQKIPADLFRNILQRSTDLINAQDQDGNTALHIGFLKNSQGAITLLLAHSDVDVNVRNHENRTPLHCATMCKDIPTDLYQQIIQKSTSDTINAKDKDGNTALHIAMMFRLEKDEFKVKELLGDVRVSVDIENNEKDTALGLASKLLTTFPLELFKMILEKSKNVNAKDKDGNTALHVAISHKSEIAVKELLNHKKVSVDVKNNLNQSVYHHASNYWNNIPKDFLKIISKKSIEKKMNELKNSLVNFSVLLVLDIGLLYLLINKIK